MVDAARSLEERGHVVVLPSNISDHVAGSVIEDSVEKMQFDVFRDYFEKIGKSDGILVVNAPKDGVENYIGPNVLIEMAFAYVLDKTIYLLHDKPIGNVAEEVEAMSPVVLYGDIDSL